VAKGLDNWTNDELTAELERRRTVETPTRQVFIDWTPILNEAQHIVACILEEEGRPPKDCDHYLFEVVMTTIYGKDFFTWWNKNANY